MNISKSLVFLVLLCIYSSSIVSQQNCVKPPLAGDNCATAPLLSCNLDGYMSSTAPFSASGQPLGFCGIVENNQYLSFEADENPIIIEIVPSNCRDSKGIQAAIYYGMPDCDNLVPVSNCSSYGYENPLTVVSNNAIIGETYYLMVDGFEGDLCDFTVNVKRGILPDVEAVANNTTLCLGSTVDLDATGSTSRTHVVYHWTASNGGNIINGVNSLTPTVDALGDYTITVLDTLNCCIDTKTISVIENTNFPNAVATVSGAIDCNNSSIILNGTASSTGNFTYDWTTNNGQITSNTDAISAIANKNGNYQLTVINNQTGCSASADVLLQIDTIRPDASIALPNTITCHDPMIPLEASSTTNAVSYNWTGPSNFSANNSSPMVGSAGTYELIVTAPNGCTKMLNTSVAIDTISPNASALADDILDCDTDQVILNGYSSTTGVSYTWTGPGSYNTGNKDAIAVEAGSYTLTVEAGNGCTNAVDIDVLQDFSAPNISTDTPDILNCVIKEVELRGASTTDNVNYKWIGPNSFNENIAKPLASLPGMYVFIVNGQNACTSKDTVYVSEDVALPIADAGEIQTLTCGTSEVTLNGAASSTGSNFNYTWLDSDRNELATTSNVIVETVGTYDLIVTNNINHCTAVATIEVNENLIAPIADAGNPQTLSCTATQVALSGIASSTGSNYTYEWEDAANNTIANTINTNINTAGTYELIVSNTDNDCTASATVIVDQDISTPTAAIDEPEDLTCARTSVTLTNSLSSTGSDFEYEWQDGFNNSISNAATAEANNTGNYHLIVTDITNGCTAIATTNINEDLMPPTADAGTTQTLTCDGNGVTLDGSASSIGNDYTYEWQNTNNINVGNGLSTTVNAPDTYQLMVSNTINGCTAIANVVVDEDMNAPLADAGSAQTITCSNTTVALDGTASATGTNYTYEWQDEMDNTIGNTININVANTGTYTLIVTDLNNDCASEALVAVDINTVAPTAATATTLPLTCNRTDVVLDGSPSSTGSDYTYEWQDAANNTIATTINANASTIGTYELIVTDQNNDCTASTQIEVIEDVAEPTAAIAEPQNLTCTRTSVTLSNSLSSTGSDFEYEWQDGFNNSISNTATAEANNTGNYHLIVTDITNGCTAMASTNVNEDLMPPNANAGAAQTLTCDGNGVILDGSASSIGSDYSYEWQNTNNINVGNGINTTVNVPDTYQLMVSNTINGCTAIASVIVDEDVNAPIANAGNTQTITCGATTVTLNGTASATGSNYTYEWQDAMDNTIGNTINVNVANTGTYTLIVTDLNNDCASEALVAVDINTVAPTAATATTLPLTCSRTDVVLDGSPSSTGSDYTYEWQDAANNTIATTINANASIIGTYELIVTDQNNDCTASTQIEVIEDVAEPIAAIAEPQNLTCTRTSVTLSNSLSSTGSDFEYEWQDGFNNSISNTATAEANNTGNYHLIVTDITNGCTAMATTNVNEDLMPPNANAGATQTLTCDGNGVTLDGSASSTGNDYTYAWQNANNINVGNGISTIVNAPDSYQLIVTNTINGCTAVSNVVVDENMNAPLADAGNTQTITCSNTKVELNGTASAIGANYSYEWQDAMDNIIGNTINVNVQDTGIYTLIVTDINNDCTSEALVAVDINTIAPMAATATALPLTCSRTDVVLDGSPSSTGSDYTYEWQDAANNTIATTINANASAIGTYELIVTDQNNACTASTQIEVIEDVAEPIAAIAEPQNLTCTRTSVTLSNSLSSTGSDFEYEWQDGFNNSISNTATAEANNTGNYHLIVTDITNGCTAIATTNVNEDLMPPSANAGATQTLTCDGNGVTLDGSASSTGNDYIYTWQNANNINVGNGISTIVNAPNSYQLIVTNTINGCTATDNVMVDENMNAPIADAGSTQTLTCAATTVKLNGTGSATGANYSYEWQDETGNTIGNEINVNVEETGIYTLIVTDLDNDCSSEALVEVNKNITAPTAATVMALPITCSRTNVILDGSPSSTGTNYTYEWQDATNNMIANKINATATSIGIYQLIVTDSDNGCTASTQLEVTEDKTQPTAAIDEAEKLTCARTMVTLSNSLSSTGNDFEYEWRDASNNSISHEATAEANNIGDYQLIVTDITNGCTDIATINIEEDKTYPIADAGANQTLTCDGNGVVLDAKNSSLGAEYNYNWTKPNGASAGAGIQVSVHEIGLYKLNVINTDNGCASLAEVIVDENKDAPIANAGADQVLTCVVDEVVLNGTMSATGANYTYKWKNTAGNTLNTNITYEVQDTGTYTLVVTDHSNDCYSEALVHVGENKIQPTAVASIPLPINCVRPKIILDGSNSSTGNHYTYEWRDANQAVLGESISESSTLPGDYTLVVTDTNNGCTHQDIVTVIEDKTPPIAAIESAQTLTCAHNTIDLNGQGSSTGNNYTYEWRDANANILSTQLTCEVEEAATYELLVSNTDNGCTAIEAITVQADKEYPIADTNIEATITCESEEVLVNIGNSSTGANFSYEWQNQTGQSLGENSTMSFAESGTYTLVVMNEVNDCSSEANVLIHENKIQPIADSGAPDTLTCSKKEILLDGSKSSANGNIYFKWENSLGEQIGFEEYVIIETPDVYTLKIKDLDNGCEATSKVEVSENTLIPSVVIETPDTLTCLAQNITLIANPADTDIAQNYEYHWSDEANNANMSNDANYTTATAGIYELIVTDATNDCEVSYQTEVIANNDAPIVDAGTGDRISCAKPLVNLDGSASANGSDYSYEWQDENGNTLTTAQVTTTDQAGIYTLKILNKHTGCTNEDQVTITENTIKPTAIIESNSELLTCANTDILLDASNATGNMDISRQWFNANAQLLSTETTLMVSKEDIYTLVVMDQDNGCLDSLAISIAQDIELPQVNIEPAEVLTCYLDTLNLKGSALNTGDFDYAWMTNDGHIVGNNNESTLIIDEAGTYQLTISDKDNGCSDMENIIVEANQITPNVIAAPMGVIDCVNETIEISGAGSSTGDEYEYQWTTNATALNETALNIAVASAGTYTLSIQNTENGCTASQDVEVLENEEKPTAAIAFVKEPTCYGINDGTIAVDEVIGGTAPYVYAFNEAAFSTQNAAANLGEGTYNLLIQDAIGCEWDTTFVIEAPIEVTVNLEEDQEIELGESIDLEAFISPTVNIIEWYSPDDLIEDTGSEILEVMPLQTSTYYVQVQDENGCIDEDEIVILVRSDRDVFIPNVFSPNNDGTNDVFTINAGPDVESIRAFQIFDRWGNHIFGQENIPANDDNYGWDGTFRNQAMQSGVYVFYAEIQFIDGKTELFKGDVTILK